VAFLYADEDFDYDVVVELRRLGHDVLTVQEAGNAGRPDSLDLAYAVANQRSGLTFIRRHFRRLSRTVASHFGIIHCTRDSDVAALAQRIHDAITVAGNLANQLIRIIKPHTP
jgi:hypothetical protein